MFDLPWFSFLCTAGIPRWVAGASKEMLSRFLRSHNLILRRVRTKGVLIGRYIPYIFEIIDSNIILRCLRRSRQHQGVGSACHLFLMSSPPLSSHPWMCGVWPTCFSSAASQNARSRSFFVRLSSPPLATNLGMVGRDEG